MGGRAVLSDDEDDVEFDEEEESRPPRKGRDLDDRDDDEDEEDEEEEGQNEYEKDGFIVDEEEEEEEEEEQKDESDEERRRKKKKKREAESFVLDEDDYELLEDNNITGIHRPKPGSKFKRLKKAGRDSEADEYFGFSDKDGLGKNHNREENLKRSLFGDDEGGALEDIPEQVESLPGEDDDDQTMMVDDDDDDGLRDFIVEEEDEIDETGAVVRRKRVKKKSRQAPGISSSALQEAHDIFGDVDELLALRKRELERDAAESGELRGKRLEDEFEPFILAEKYMTNEDALIRETDIPERIQLSERLTGNPPVDDKSIEEESTWIYNQLTGEGFLALYGNEQVIREIEKDEIAHVLTMIHIQKFEVPFIAMYRKELCGSLLKDLGSEQQESEEGAPRIRWHKLLWAVQTLDRKWLLLQKRKAALEIYYSKRFEEEFRRVDDETRLALNKQIFKSVIEALKEAKSEKEVEDVDAKFNLHFPPGEVEADEGQFKRPKRKSHYSTCYKAGLWEVASKFGLSAEQLGHHLTYAKIRETSELDFGKDAPEDVAANFTCAMFATAQEVLKGARHMAAVEIGCEPIVRKHVRSIFMKNAVVSTSPTREGDSTIDMYHQLAAVKWLHEKPLSKFVDAQWLLIQKAEEEKLLQVTIKLPKEAQDKLLGEVRDCYLSDCVSKSAQLWDDQRKTILEDAFLNFIFPSMEKEARFFLTARSKNWLLMEYGQQLWSKVSVAPWKKKDDKKDVELDLDDESELRVMACCWGPGKPVTTFVMLDSSGELVDVLYAGSISIRSQGVAEQQRKKNDQQRVLKFMTDHQPHVVCVGAANLACRQLKDDIYEVIFKMVEDHPRDVSDGMGNLSILHGDESVPRLYENSRVSSDQLPAQSGIVKRAVALGRYLQNPLAMVATLCGPGKEILSWKLHPLEQFLTPDEKYEVVEQVMVDATNQIGFDVNLATSHEWLFAPLQFIAGLGPRKASAFQKAFVRAGSVFSRKELIEFMNQKKIFVNCAGFLRIRRSGTAAASAHVIDLLDDTRVHPESYSLAKTLAKDVYAEDAPHDINEMDEEEQELAIEHVRERPHMLKALDIDEYAKSIEGGGHKRETLFDIKMELLHGFRDWRAPYNEPGPDEEFWMLSGETEDTLAEGRIVQVTVRSILDNRIICTFDSGLKAIVMEDNYSEDGYDPENIQLREGDVLTGKIKNVNKQRFQVYLTCKASEMRRRPYHNKIKHDPYYREEDSSLRKEQEKAQKEKELAKKHFKPRMIVHPHFQNLTAEEAMKYLADKEPGERIIRPSSRGPSFLTLTLKISDGVYAHKEIAEGGKDHKDITSLLRLGKTLAIDKETFEDLDEVIDRYVDPLVVHLKNMVNYRKFRRGTKAEIDDLLRAEKAENPMRIVYYFGISHEHPGTFVLAYIRSSNPHHEYVGLYPKGFRFRKKDFDSIDRLVSYFQRNIDKPPPDAGSSKARVASAVPMKGWGSGGGTGDADTAGNNDGWRGEGETGRERPFVRSGGRFDSRNGIGGRDGGGFRPGHGRGRGRGNNFGNDGHGSDFGGAKWGSGPKDDGLRSFPGSKVQNSPGGWGGGGNDAGSWGNSGGGVRDGGNRRESGNGGWNDGAGSGGGGGGGSGGWDSGGNGESWGGGGSGGGNSGWGGGGGDGSGRNTGGWV